MNTWTPLWSGVVDSSLWDEPDYVVKVFLTMLALKDSDHVVRLNAYQIGRNSRKTEDEVLDAIRILSAKDSRRKQEQPFEGRRIKSVEDGWLILNGEKYREMVKIEMKKARDRRAQANWRARRDGKPLPYPNRHKTNDQTISGGIARQEAEWKATMEAAAHESIARAAQEPPGVNFVSPPPAAVPAVLLADRPMKLIYDRILATKGQAAADFWLANNTHHKKP